MEPETIFHKIVRGDEPCFKVWEDDKHLAFLSIFPNTEGVTVVVPKTWQPSYFADVPNDVLKDFMVAVKHVAKLLDENLENVGRTALVFEGLGINYLHAKLFPLHGTGDLKENWRFIGSDIETYFEKYEGYISSHDGPRKSDEELRITQNKIKKGGS